jgi:Ca2+-transporting ATPase
MIGLNGLAGKPITGDEVASMTDGQLRNLLHAHPGGIFARMDPDQKLRLVQTLRDLGHVVAVTGDGVNDAPALKAAHVGFAMGLRGTDVAREVADVVLLDDNFATIVSAIAQGRATFDNIRRFLTYILASNIPELVPFICMAALGIPPALTIIQILLVDLGTDLAPAVALGMEKPAHDVMKRPPIRPGERLLSWRLIGRAYGLLGVWEAFAAMGAFFSCGTLMGMDSRRSRVQLERFSPVKHRPQQFSFTRLQPRQLF